MNWSESVQGTIHAAFEQVEDIAQWGREMSLPQTVIDGMTAPYKNLIEDAYRNDTPLAQLIDKSDLVIGVSGDSIEHGKAPVAVMAELFTEARLHIGKIVASIEKSINNKLVGQLPLMFTDFAPGSVYLGFTIQEIPSAQLSMSSNNIESTREALKVLGLVTHLLEEDAPPARFKDAHHNPDVVDAALRAVNEFTPSQKSSYSRITIGGTSLSLEEREGSAPIVVLTSDYRPRIKLALSRPKEPRRKQLAGTITGTDPERGQVTIQLRSANPQASLKSFQADDKVAIRRIEPDTATEKSEIDNDQSSIFDV